uniref:Hypothetical 13.9K protein n=1 Tax=Culex quinquefasciatus TaxID=7176 RepID=Q7M475_CULQU
MIQASPPRFRSLWHHKKIDKKAWIFSILLKEWKITPNVLSKTQLIIFPHKPRADFLKPKSHHIIKMNEVNLKWEDQVKYLGLGFDKNLTYKDHIESIQVKCNKYIKCFVSTINSEF